MRAVEYCTLLCGVESEHRVNTRGYADSEHSVWNAAVGRHEYVFRV